MNQAEDDSAGPVFELTLRGLTHGAEAVGRLPSGKACFVPFAIPGERVRVEVVEERRSWARGRLVEILEPSADRVTAPCPYFGQERPDGTPRCGGCALQHVAPERQAAMKRQIVTEQLERIGRFTAPPVAETVTPEKFAYREQARFAVDPAGHLGFRRAGTHKIVPIDDCLLLTPEAQRVRTAAGDQWRGAKEVVVRAGQSRRGALVVTPGSGGMPELPEGDDAVAIAGPGRTVDLRGDATVHRSVAGLRYRVSPGSFFQAGTVGAEALVALVRAAAAVTRGETVLDLFAGVGLFSRALAAEGARVTAVESSRSAAQDARHNLADGEGAGDAEDLQAEVLTEPAEAVVHRFAEQARWFDVVVLDPPRRGAGPRLCVELPRLEPRAVVYVSCDPAALARDARVLVDAGLHLELVTPVDVFAQTASIESVAVLRGSSVPRSA